MQIIATCPCGQQYHADSVQVGAPLQCSTCGQVFIITAAAPAPPQQAIQDPGQAGYVLENRYGQPSPVHSPPLPPQQANPQYSVQSSAHPVPPQADLNPLPLTPLDPSASDPKGSPAGANYAYSTPRRPANLKPWLLAIGGGAGAILVVVLCLLLFRGNKLSNGMDLTFLPANLSQFYFVNIEKLQATKSGKNFLNNDFLAKQHLGSVQRITQLDLDDIESITVGYASSGKRNPFDISSQVPFAGFNVRRTSHFCGVIRTRAEYDKDRILRSMARTSKQEHSGHEYYRVDALGRVDSERAHVLAFPNERTLLYGSEKEVKAALTGSQAPNDSMFTHVGANDHVVVSSRGDSRGAFGLVNSGLAISFADEVTGRMWSEFESSDVAREIADAQQRVKSASKVVPQIMPAKHRQNFERLIRQGDPFGFGDIEVAGNTVVARLGSQNEGITRTILTQAVVNLLQPFQQISTLVHSTPIRSEQKQARNKIEQHNEKIQKAKQNAQDMIDRMKKDIERINRVEENAKVKKPVARKVGLQSTNLATLPRYKPGVGNKMNLLEVFDMDKDKIKGTWAFEGESLVCKSLHFRPRIQFPYKPPEEYDFKVSFKQAAPRGNLSLILPNKGKSFSWILSASHLHQFTVSRIKQNDTRIKVDSIIKPNKLHTLVIQKRTDSVKAVLDGHILSEFKGDFRDLDEDRMTSINNKQLLGFACETPTTISVAELTEVKGKGAFVE